MMESPVKVYLTLLASSTIESPNDAAYEKVRDRLVRDLELKGFDVEIENEEDLDEEMIDGELDLSELATETNDDLITTEIVCVNRKNQYEIWERLDVSPYASWECSDRGFFGTEEDLIKKLENVGCQNIATCKNKALRCSLVDIK